MAIPDRKFEFVHPEELTLDELIFLSEWGNKKEMSPGEVATLKGILVSAGNYTDAEVGAVKLSELAVLFEALQKAAKEDEAAAVPLASDASSTSSPVATPTKSRSGRGRAK